MARGSSPSSARGSPPATHSTALIPLTLRSQNHGMSRSDVLRPPISPHRIGFAHSSQIRHQDERIRWPAGRIRREFDTSTLDLLILHARGVPRGPQTGQIVMVLPTTGQIWSCTGLIWAPEAPICPVCGKAGRICPVCRRLSARQPRSGTSRQIPASYPQSGTRFHRAQRRFCVMHIVFDRRSSPPPHHGPTSHSHTIRTK